MKIFTSHKLFFTGLICLFIIPSLNAQMMLKEISLEQQIEKSSLVVEGKVIAKGAFWDIDHKLIYTSNTVEVYKVFKGNPLKTIEVITVGGTVGLNALIASNSLKLQKGDIGIFTLYDSNISTDTKSHKSNNKKLRAYGLSQGFYKYNLYNEIVVNAFNKKQDISSSFYNEIQGYTKKNYIEISSFDIKSKKSKSISSKGILSPDAITFTPNATSAGTESTITITIPGGAGETDFGSIKGKVAFANADDGGSTFIDALDTQVQWSNTSITVEVPSSAGTGKIRVTTSDDSSIISVNDLTILYSEINVVYDADDETGSGGVNGPLEAFSYSPQHVNINGSGGYTWQMHTDFNSNSDAKAAFERSFNKWVCETGINWVIGATTTVDVVEFESASPSPSDPPVNVIRFDNGSELDPTTLGVCYSWYKGCSAGGGEFEWFVAEMDLVFDDDTDWNFGPEITPAIFGKYDFESVVLHELGHGHQLGHVIDDSPPVDNGNDVMHYALQSVEDQRVLSANNITAANNVQNRSIGPAPSCNEPLMTGASCPLSVEDQELAGAISIYPNPTTGQFYIESGTAINLEKVVIYDVHGRLISNIDLSNNSKMKTINLSGASKGLYFVNIHSDNGMITKKIILE
ncbi:MAG: T9SS type A sorting domain-containing protein [Algibacter sp.]